MINTRTVTRQEASTPIAGRGTLQKLGGVAALLLGLFNAAYLAAFLFILPSLGFQASMFQDPPRFVAFISSQYSLYYALGLAGVLVTPALIVIVRALDERVRATTVSPSFAAIAATFGYVGATLLFVNWLFAYSLTVSVGSAPAAYSSQVAASATYDMTNIGASLAIGVWIMLLSWARIRHGGSPKGLAYFGVLVAATAFLALFGLRFGALLLTIWFLAMGFVLLSGKAPSAGEMS